MSGINLKSKDVLESLRMFEDDRKISSEFIIDTLKDAIIKTYQKHIDAPAAEVRVDVDGKEMKIYHDLTVVEDSSEKFDETLDIRLSDALKINPLAEIGSKVAMEVDFNEIGRSAISTGKNMLKQRIKEYEKQRVYEEYQDKVYDLVSGIIKTVEDKFLLVDIRNTIAILPKSEQIPGEIYREDQQIRAVIKDVSKSSKGSQVTLSRADAMFVKRLFEKDVPEIAQGIVEIKAIARDAGERTKMAVYTKNEDVDPIGSCIGPRGSRVQGVIQEIKGEKIDIFEWNDDIGELVKNALAPAHVEACFYADEDYSGLSEEEIARRKNRLNRPLVVVVGDDQLSSAIGKKGKNAKLAVKLTERKIDIKTMSDVLASGVNIEERVNEFKEDQIRIIKEREMKKFMALQEEALKRKAEFDEKMANEGDIFEEALEEMDIKEDDIDDVKVEEVFEEPIEEVKTEETLNEEVVSEEETLEKTDEAIDEAEEVVESEALEEVKEAKEEEKAVKEERVIKTRKVNTDYVSRFEDIAGSSGAKKEETVTKRRRKKADEDERRLRASELKKDKDYEIKPEYTDEELEEIELAEALEEEDSWINDDIDFDEYDDYYDKD